MSTMVLEEDGSILIDVHGEIWDGEGDVTSGEFVGKYRHAELHAVNGNHYRMIKKENAAFGLNANQFQTMRLPNESNWVKALEKYPIGKVITISKVNFEICKVEVTLPVEAFNNGKDITECTDFYLDVYFNLEGSKVNPSDIIIQIG
ncbi:hypothetical protein [Neobacillus sp. B4I6]|uniref:hypothetical protein n=1 Tax=Neobacillus sp. B4I6 TaxID=3373925 RepID=UPI003D2016F5